MKRVYKYPIRIEDRQVVGLPKGAEILSMQIQKGNLCLYALVDASVVEIEFVPICIYGTGHNIENADNLKFIGSAKMHEGELVLHVFEELKK